ncbi:MAG: DUF401 family protein [Patescibacteria group bacterium]|nr:DUF401 family protein [Patescibacteria group bacterium]
MAEVIAARLKHSDYTKKLNLVFNAMLMAIIAVALPQVLEPGKVLVKGFLKLENIQVLYLFIGVLFVVNVYKQIGNIADYLLYWTRFIPNPRLALVFTSLILAIMPVKGRTIISAPIIGQIAEKHRLNKFSAAMVDFVSTHIVYLVLPIEGSVIVVLTTFAVLGFHLGTFISYMLPGIVFLVGVVTYYSWKTSRGTTLELPRTNVTFPRAVKVTLPLLLLMASLYLYEMRDVTYAIIIGTTVFVGLSLAILKPTPQQTWNAVKTMDKQLILTLGLIFLFAATVSQLPWIKQLASEVVTSGYTIPALIIVGYLAGFILGSSSGMATLIFPLLFPLIQAAPNAFQIIAITYAAMYAGYVASPAHPCCHYAASYFDTPYLKVWSRVAMCALGASGCIIAVALVRG